MAIKIYESGMEILPGDILIQYIDTMILPVLVRNPEGKQFLTGEQVEVTAAARINDDNTFTSYWALGSFGDFDPSAFVQCTSLWSASAAWGDLITKGMIWQPEEES